MQIQEPAGGPLDWQIEQYGPNGPLPHPGRGPFFCVRAAAGVQSIFCETMGKNIRVHTAILVLFAARQTGARQCYEKITAMLYSTKAANLREKSAILAGDSALLPINPAKPCTEFQHKLGCNIASKIFQMRDSLEKFYLCESFMRKIHK